MTTDAEFTCHEIEIWLKLESLNRNCRAIGRHWEFRANFFELVEDEIFKRECFDLLRFDWEGL